VELEHRRLDQGLTEEEEEEEEEEEQEEFLDVAR
jgi:hypothetical protein